MDDKNANNPLFKWFYSLPDHYQKWSYFIIAMLCFVVIYKMNETHNQNHFVSSLIAEQNEAGFIPVYGPVRHPQTIMVMELLKMYGFTPKVLGESDGSYVYVKLADGSRVETPEFTERIIKLKLIDFHPGSTSPVVLYGVKDCPYAQKAKDMLEQRGIAYQYIDLNEDALSSQGITDARFLVSDHGSKKSMRNPYLEYNGKIYDTPALYQAIQDIRQ